MASSMALLHPAAAVSGAGSVRVISPTCSRRPSAADRVSSRRRYARGPPALCKASNDKNRNSQQKLQLRPSPQADKWALSLGGAAGQLIASLADAPRSWAEEALETGSAVVEEVTAAAAAAAAAPEDAIAAFTESLPQVDLPDIDFSSLELPSLELPDIDLSGVDADTAVLGVAAAATSALFATSVSLLFRKGYAGDVPPEAALQAVLEQGAVLVDVRSGKEKSADGSPQVKGAKRGQTTVVVVPFLKQSSEGSKGGDDDAVVVEDPGFAATVLAKKGVEEESKLIVVDKSGSTAVAVAAAKALTKAGVKKTFVLKGGADAWKEAGLGWKEPGLALNLLLPSLAAPQLDGLKSAISSTVSSSGGSLPTVLAVLAAAGATVAVVAEAEAVLQLLGSVAVGQFLIKKFLFAKDREETIAQLKAFVVPKERLEAEKAEQEAAKVAAAAKKQQEAAAAAAAAEAAKLSPPKDNKDTNGAASVTPAPAPVAPTAVAAAAAAPAVVEEKAPAADVEAAEVPPPPPPPPAASAAPPAAAVAPSAAATEAAAAEPPAPKKDSTDLPPTNRPLSPYTLYPDLKPPTSPTPRPPM